MPEKLPVVALIGPPNAGKSTLFNTIIGKRLAVTGPTPGTTRDRSYGLSSWRNKNFLLVDTAGLASKSGDLLERDIKEQTKLAITEADLIIFVIDGKLPITEARNSAKELKTVLRENKLTNKIEIIATVNKVDSVKNKIAAKTEFSRLGLGDALPISALTGTGVGDLLDGVVSKIKQMPTPDEKEVFATVAVVGRPNVGKSTLINSLLGYKRVVVSQLPGTTRASVDVEIVHDGKILRFIDTAGMRRRARINVDVEEYSLFQAIKSIERADVVVLLLDASINQARFEQTIAGLLKENIKGIVIGLNKTDLFSDPRQIEQLKQFVPMTFPFLRFVKVVAISAEKGTNMSALLKAIIEAKQSRDKVIPQPELSRSLKFWIKNNPPKKLRAQKKPIIYDLKQINNNPPNFNLIVNEPAAIHFSFLRYLENQLRKDFGFAGTAIKIKPRKPIK